MPAILCPACENAPQASGLAVCWTCRDNTRRRLDILDETYDELLLPRARSGERRGQGHARPAPMSDRIGDIRFEIRDTLLAWAGYMGRVLNAEGMTTAHTPDDLRGTRLVGTPGGDLPAVTNYLRTHEHVLLGDDQAPAYVSALAYLVRAVERVNGTTHKGIVIAVHDCGGTVRADSINGHGKCGTCGTRAPLNDWAPANPDAVISDSEAVRYVAVSTGRTVTLATVRSWRFRGHIPAQTRRSLDAYLNPA